MEKYIVTLTQEEREYLLTLIRKGKGSASKLTYARVFLAIDENNPEFISQTDKKTALLFHIDPKFISRARKKFIEQGLESAITRKAYPRTRMSKIKGCEEAHLIAMCCSKPPEGRSRWTLQLLANTLVKMNIIDSVSPSTVGRALKKMN
jgi:hypothetical protein